MRRSLPFFDIGSTGRWHQDRILHSAMLWFQHRLGLGCLGVHLPPLAASCSIRPCGLDPESRDKGSERLQRNDDHRVYFHHYHSDAGDLHVCPKHQVYPHGDIFLWPCDAGYCCIPLISIHTQG